jgi:CHAD domain-containing protein
MAGTFLQTQLRTLDQQLESTLPRVLSHASDEEAIHDMRVAIRRIRTILRLCRPLFGRFHADAVRQVFTDVQRATGALRDEEVLEETLESLAVRDTAFTAYRHRRRARERALRRSVMLHLRAGELDRARDLLHAVVALPVRPKRDEALAQFARRSVDQARKRVEKLRDVPTADAAGLHALRIAYKNLRYAAEILGDALPADLAAMAKPAAHFQKRLGELHDVDVALATVERARALPPRTRGRALRALHGARTQAVDKYVAEMSPAEAKETKTELASPPGSTS